MNIAFTEAELAYLRGQRLARLATVDSAGAPQNNPVGYFLDEAAQQFVIAGTAMGRSRKYRNVRRNAWVSVVVDDLASTDPWRVRGIEVRGSAEAQMDVDPPMEGLSREVIRITPRWIGSWGLKPDQEEFSSRGTQADAPRESPGRSADEAAPRLLDAYFRGFDERRNDRAWLASIFSADATVSFPAAQGKGLMDLAGLSEKLLGLWAATLHQTSNHHVVVASGEADLTAALTATHVHRSDDAGAHLRIGARVSGHLIRLREGWRFSSLSIALVWSEGDGPTPPGAPASRRSRL